MHKFWQMLRRYAPERQFLRDTVLLGSGMALAQLLVLGAMPVWSRLYTPADFGLLGIWAAISGIVSIVLTLRYDTTIVVATDEPQARALAQGCIWLIAGLGGILFALALSLPNAAREWLGVAELGVWLPWAVVAGALSALLAVGQYWLNRQQAYGAMTLARIALGAASALGGIVLGMLDPQTGLLLTQLLALMVAIICLLVGGRKLSTLWQTRVGRSDLVHAAQMHSNAPRYLWPSALLDVVTQQLPFLLVPSWYSQELAGQFSLTWRVVAVPMFMLASAAGIVFYQRMASLAGQPAKARHLLFSTWQLFAFLALLPALLLGGWGEAVFAWIFGAEWAMAGRMAAIMAPMLCLMFISSPTSSSLIVWGLQKWSLWFGLLMLVYRPAALWLGAWQGSIEMGLRVWVACEVVAILLYNALILRALRH